MRGGDKRRNVRHERVARLHAEVPQKFNVPFRTLNR